MLASEQNHLITISEEINKWLQDKNNFRKRSNWLDKCEGYINQAENLAAEMKAKADELNEPSDGFLDLWRDTDTEEFPLSEIVQIMNHHPTH